MILEIQTHEKDPTMTILRTIEQKEREMSEAQAGRPVTAKQAACLSKYGVTVTATCDGEKASCLIGFLKVCSNRAALVTSVVGTYREEGWVN